MQKEVKSHKIKNLFLVLLGFSSAIFLSNYGPFHDFLLNLGFLGALIGGIMFVSTFTFPTGILILLVLAQKLPSYEVALMGAIGGLITNLIVFNLVKEDLSTEVEGIYKHFEGNHFAKLSHTKYFGWFLPVIGAILIALPLPDEIGISLLGLSKISTFKFVIISLVLNFIAIFLVVSASVIIK